MGKNCRYPLVELGLSVSEGVQKFGRAIEVVICPANSQCSSFWFTPLSFEFRDIHTA
jgi:hypothetical protein